MTRGSLLTGRVWDEKTTIKRSDRPRYGVTRVKRISSPSCDQRRAGHPIHVDVALNGHVQAIFAYDRALKAHHSVHLGQAGDAGEQVRSGLAVERMEHSL